MAITITKQPANIACFVGDTVYFTVEATGDSLSYQWQYNIPGNANWHSASGNNSTGTNATMEFIPKAYHNGYNLRCKITDASGDTAYSNAVKVMLLDVSNYSGRISSDSMLAIADAIRAKTETSARILPADMAGMIEGFSDLPDGISEIEVVTCAGSGTYTLTVPCSLSDTPACVAVYSAEFSEGSQAVSAGVWANNQFVFWYGSSHSVYIYQNDSPLSDGVLTIKAYANSSSAARFVDDTYYCVMWR